ncbi:MAG: protoheme IX farnesyltransferase [Actinobacteria bacterium]|nr:protoheme IX farnesyltransferase [Actinomycetota bacterium]
MFVNSPTLVPFRINSFFALTKPAIIRTLLITTVPTMFVAERGTPSAWLIIATMVGGSFAAAGANCFNMVLDVDIDKRMNRTINRPLVTGVITPKEATVFASILEIGAFIWLLCFVNLLSAVLAISATAFYVFVYTMWLKRSSTSNIVIGGAAGAVPVLIGWAAVTETLGWAPVLLFSVIFFWTPPHFWALAINYRDDYEAAGIPMLPVVTGLKETGKQIVVYSVVLIAFSISFFFVAEMGLYYLSASLVLGALFLFFALKIRFDPTEKNASNLFRYSITYIFLLFSSMVLDVLL